MNLFKAIEVEEEYLKLLTDKELKAKFNLAERLELCGYTLEEYHKEKNALLFLQPKKFVKGYCETLHETEQNIMTADDAVCLVVSPTKKWVYVGGETVITDQEASRLDIGHDCQSVLATPLDISPVFVSKHTGAFELYLNWIRGELKAEELDAGIVGVERNFGEYSIYYFHLSFSGEGREKLEKRWLQ